MEVRILREAGYEEALRGMSYSYLDEAVDVESWWEGQKAKAVKRAAILCLNSSEHRKFLRHISVWVDIKATRAFWVEFDTYQVGTSRLSASTMHKLDKREPVAEDFSPTTHPVVIEAFKQVWREYKAGELDIVQLKDALPEGYLQRREVILNYESLRTIISQRKGHRYYYWAMFILAIANQIEHPELLEGIM